MNDTKWWVSRAVICKHCHAVIQMEAKDKVKHSGKLDETRQVYFACPECKTTVHLYEHPMPK